MTTVITVCWPHDAQPLATSAQRIVALRAVLVASFPALSGMRAEARDDGARVPFDEPAACEALLMDGAVKHHFERRGGDALTHHLGASLSRGEWPLVTLGVNLATGLSERLDPFAPANSIELGLHEFDASAAQLEQMLRILLRIFPSPWGYVGSDIIPSHSLDGDGVPLIGWLSYLHRDYGKPTSRPPKGVDVQVTEGGRIIRAFDGLMCDSNDEHIDGVEAVRQWLRASGMLRRYADFVANPYVEPAVKEEAPRSSPAAEPASQPAPLAAVAAPAMVPNAAATASAKGAGLPFVEQPAALPFVAGDGRTPAPVASTLEPNAEMGSTAGPNPSIQRQAVTPFGDRSPLEPHPAMGATTAASGDAKRATPFTNVELPMSLSKLVKLGVALTVKPDDRVSILADHDLDESSFAALSDKVKAALAQDPNLNARYHSLFERMLGMELANTAATSPS